MRASRSLAKTGFSVPCKSSENPSVYRLFHTLEPPKEGSGAMGSPRVSFGTSFSTSWAPLGRLWGSLGVPWVPFGLPLAPCCSPRASLGRLWVSIGLPLGSLWLPVEPLGSPWEHFGSLWMYIRNPFGPLGSPKEAFGLPLQALILASFLVQLIVQFWGVMLVRFVSISCCLFSVFRSPCCVLCSLFSVLLCSPFFVFFEVRYGFPLGAPWFSKARGRAKRGVARLFERIG